MNNFAVRGITGSDSVINQGSHFDNARLLMDAYCGLLFFALSNEGIVYSTNRNAILAKVVFANGKEGFTNYVQPSIGTWNYDNAKYQRNVSPDFILWLFNSICLDNCLTKVNEFDQSPKIKYRNSSLPDCLAIENFTIANLEEAYQKINKGESAYSAYLKSAYSLVKKISEYGADFVNFHEKWANAYQKHFYCEREEFYRNYKASEQDSGFFLNLNSFREIIRNRAEESLLNNESSNYSDPVCTETLLGFYKAIAIDYQGAKEFNNDKVFKKEK